MTSLACQNGQMRFGLFLPPFGPFAAPRRVAGLARTAEDSGWDGLFLWDHLLSLPSLEVADPWVTLAASAMVTSDIRLGVLVTPLSRRRPSTLARQLATVDGLSNGRLVAGIGIGDDGWREFSAFGEATDPVERGRILDESLTVLQGLLSGEPFRFSGEHHTVDAPAFVPRPMQDPLPIWAACRWPHRRPLARAASVQGCFPIFPTDPAGPIPIPDAAEVAQVRRQLVDLGAGPGHDLIVRASLSAVQGARMVDVVPEQAAAGVTWLLEGFGPSQPPEDIDQIVAAGPPNR